MCQNALNWVPSGLKWHQYELKRVKTGSKCGPEGSHASQMSNTPKWPFPGQICLSPHRRGSTRHSKMGGAGTGTPQRRVLRLGSRFLPKIVHRVGGLPYVHGVYLPPPRPPYNDPYSSGNGRKRSVLGPKFCRRSKFEGDI